MAYYNCEKCDARMHVRHYKVSQHIRRPICLFCYKNSTLDELAYFNEEPIVIEETNEQWEARIRLNLTRRMK